MWFQNIIHKSNEWYLTAAEARPWHQVVGIRVLIEIQHRIHTVRKIDVTRDRRKQRLTLFSNQCSRSEDCADDLANLHFSLLTTDGDWNARNLLWYPSRGNEEWPSDTILWRSKLYDQDTPGSATYLSICLLVWKISLRCNFYRVRRRVSILRRSYWRRCRLR
jgi:hypothetical protein